jgi:hypothetical protein
MVANEHDSSVFYVSDTPVDDGQLIDVDVTDLDTDLFDVEAFDLSLDLAEYIELDVDEVHPVEQLVEEDVEEDAEYVAEPVMTEPGLPQSGLTELGTAQPAVFDRTAFEAPVFDAATTAGTRGDDFDFSVVWPDDSQESTTEATSSSRSSVGVIEREAAPDGIVTQSEDGRLEFTLPPLMLSDEPELADAGVPDDVADAVRRAIAAIESVSGPAPTLSAPETTAEVLETGDVDIENPAASGSTMMQPPGAALGGFAPPTMATRAEVLYGLTEDDSAVAGSTSAGSSSVGWAGPVFVGDQPVEGAGGGNERSSALRRLIGSLRRKDH